jgi:hypothetical protein
MLKKIGMGKVIASRNAKSLAASNQRIFGPVTTIDTAPVAIGNSVRGVGVTTKQTKNGVILTGRDFMFSAKGSGTIATWCMVGGTPITAACFTDSAIRSYMQMYQKFKVRKIVAHYITSSATSSTGDVLFYFQKNANSVFINQTSTQLLPLVMSDKNTVLGPQWTNHSTELALGDDTWKSTDYGMNSDLNEYSFGNLFLLSKTSTTDSPGYVIFDYVIEFCELQVSPRLLTLPISRIQWSQCSLGRAGAAVTAASFLYPFNGIGPTANDISGIASALPSGITTGDVYKVIIDITNSNTGAWTNCTAANLISLQNNGAYKAFTIIDGTTLYAVWDDNGGGFYLHQTVESAFANFATTGGNQLHYGVAATVTYNLQCWLSYVGSIGANNVTSNF